MATKVRDYRKLAADIKDAIGESNFQSATHCATRLRLILKNTPDAAVTKKIEQMAGVIQVVQAQGQYQIVIGTHAKDVYEHLSGMMNLSSDVPPVKESLVNRFIATMSGCIAPYVYVMAAAGLLHGILIIVKMFADVGNTGAAQIYNMISWTPFTFLPVFIAEAGSLHFKCNTYIAVWCCMALATPPLGKDRGYDYRGNSAELPLCPPDLCYLYLHRHSAYHPGGGAQCAGALAEEETARRGPAHRHPADLRRRYGAPYHNGHRPYLYCDFQRPVRRLQYVNANLKL